MSNRLATLPGRLRRRRRLRLADRINGNDRFPTPVWRYLVPDTDTLIGTGPWPTGVSGGDGVIHGGLDQLVENTIEAGSGVDTESIALLVEPTVAELSAVISKLGAGGRLVVELHPARHQTVSAVRERLAGMGLTVDEVYSVSPSGDAGQPTLWFPTSAAGPVHEVLRAGTPWPGRGRIRRFARTAAVVGSRWSATITDRPWLLFPSRPWVLLAVAGVSARADLDSEGERRPGLRVLRIGGSSTDQAVMTHHDPTDGRPTAVTKLPTDPSEMKDLQVEAANLRLLHRAAPDLPRVPRVVAAAGPDKPGPCYLTQSYVPGIPLAAVLDDGNYDHWLDAVTGWVGLLGQATGVKAEPLHRTVHGWLDEIGDALPDLAAKSRPFIDRLELDLRVTQHLDFGPWNIHGDPGGVGVIDWVTADRTGLPMGDLVHYATHAAAVVAGGYGYDELRAVHRESLDPLTPIGRSVAAAMARYCADLDIEQALVPGLRLATWIGSVRRRLPAANHTIYMWLWEWELASSALLDAR